MALTGLIYSTSKENDREQWRCSLAVAGLSLVNGSFEEGATVNSQTDVVWHISGGQCYAWHGEFPKDISAGTTPVGVADWEPQTDLKDRWLYKNKLQRTDPFGDIKADGAAAVSIALANLGLGNLKYGAPMIGALVEWPRSEMPQEIWPDCGMEFIPYMGQSFDFVKYPMLAQLHPTNKLPADMRGYVPRGWDNGRGIDIARVLMSSQEDAIRNIVGTWSPITGGYQDNAFSGAVTRDTGTQYSRIASNLGGSMNGLKFDASLSVPTASENRVRSVAWNMIVRAK